MTAPVTSVHAFAVLGVRSIVREVDAFGRIGVEVVVEVYTIDIVAIDDVHDYIGDELTIFGQPGVKVHLVITLVGDKTPRLAVV